MDYLYNLWSAAKNNKLSKESFQKAFVFFLLVYIVLGIAINLSYPKIRDREIFYYDATKDMYEGKTLNVVAREQLSKIYVLNTVYRPFAASSEGVQIFFLRLSGLIFGVGTIIVSYYAVKRFFSGDEFAPFLAIVFLSLGLTLNIQMFLIGGESFPAFIFAFFLYGLVEIAYRRRLEDIIVGIVAFVILNQVQPELSLLGLFLLVSAMIFGIYREYEEPIRNTISRMISERGLILRAVIAGFVLLLYIIYRFFALEISAWWSTLIRPLGDFAFTSRKFFMDAVFYFFQSGETAVGFRMFDDIIYYASIFISLLGVIGLIFFIGKIFLPILRSGTSNSAPISLESLFVLFISMATVYFIVANLLNFSFVFQRNYVALLILPLSILFIAGLREVSYRSETLFDFSVLIFLTLNVVATVAVFVF